MDAPNRLEVDDITLQRRALARLEARVHHWTADQCLTGGDQCSHRHRTQEAAERCLPRCPKPSGGTTYFSMAQVHAHDVDGRDLTDAIDQARMRLQGMADDEEYESRQSGNTW